MITKEKNIKQLLLEALEKTGDKPEKVRCMFSDKRALTELAYLKDITLGFHHKPHSFFHGICPFPGHELLLSGAHPPSLDCHPCSRSILLPMYPVCTLRCTPSASSTYRTVRLRGPLSRVAQRTQVVAFVAS